jgi:hypothetical protein
LPCRHEIIPDKNVAKKLFENILEFNAGYLKTPLTNRNEVHVEIKRKTKF